MRYINAVGQLIFVGIIFYLFFAFGIIQALFDSGFPLALIPIVGTPLVLGHILIAFGFFRQNIWTQVSLWLIPISMVVVIGFYKLGTILTMQKWAANENISPSLIYYGFHYIISMLICLSGLFLIVGILRARLKSPHHNPYKSELQ